MSVFDLKFNSLLCSLDEETRLRQSLSEQLATSLTASAAVQHEVDELRLTLKTSEDRVLVLQAELAKASNSNAALRDDVAAAALKIANLESELFNLRAAVSEKLPLADRVLQLENDARASALSIQEAKAAHDAALSSFSQSTMNFETQIASLTAEKAVLLQTLQSVQSEAEERYNQTFKTKEEYILQVEAAESALEQARQQLLQLQLTCNDLRSRVEATKQSESHQAVALLETTRKQVFQLL